MMPNLAIIIVSWNVRELLRRCLRSIDSSLAGSGISCTVVVVDNASSDGTATMLQHEFPTVRLLEPGCNLGFAGGNNLALRSLGFTNSQLPTPNSQLPTPNSQLPSSVLLLNPDTEIIGDALPQLVRYLEAHPDVIAVGPRLQYGDGTTQSSRRRFPTRPTFFWESTPLERAWTTNPWAHAYHCADRSDALEQQVDWLVGAALLVRGEAISQAGLLDEGFFMYSEELEWQYRLTTHNATATHSHMTPRIIYLPTTVIIHHEGKSSEQMLSGRHINFQQSKIQLARLLHGNLFAGILRIFLLGCYVWELAVESAKYMVGHRRGLRRTRIDVYTTVLRSGLRH